MVSSLKLLTEFLSRKGLISILSSCFWPEYNFLWRPDINQNLSVHLLHDAPAFYLYTWWLTKFIIATFKHKIKKAEPLTGTNDTNQTKGLTPALSCITTVVAVGCYFLIYRFYNVIGKCQVEHRSWNSFFIRIYFKSQAMDASIIADLVFVKIKGLPTFISTVFLTLFIVRQKFTKN